MYPLNMSLDNIIQIVLNPGKVVRWQCAGDAKFSGGVTLKDVILYHIKLLKI